MSLKQSRLLPFLVHCIVYEPQADQLVYKVWICPVWCIVERITMYWKVARNMVSSARWTRIKVVVLCGRYLLVIMVHFTTAWEFVAGRLKSTLFRSDCVNHWCVWLPDKINLCNLPSSYQSFYLARNAVKAHADCMLVILDCNPSASSGVFLHFYCLSLCATWECAKNLKVHEGSWVVKVWSTALNLFCWHLFCTSCCNRG